MKSVFSILRSFIPSVYYKNNSYSLEGEDIVLKNITHSLNIHKGLYIDVGCFNPHYISNTYYLHQRGWHGINIDPNLQTIKLFNKYRPKDINLNIGCGSVEKIVDYIVFDSNPYKASSSTNTISKLFSEKRVLLGHKIKNQYPIKVVKLSSIIEKYLKNREEIDFLNIDVEGMDMDVLASLNISDNKPKIIAIEFSEYLDISSVINSDVYKFLNNYEYKLMHKSPRTGIFIRSDQYMRLKK